MFLYLYVISLCFFTCTLFLCVSLFIHVYSLLMFLIYVSLFFHVYFFINVSLFIHVYFLLMFLIYVYLFMLISLFMFLIYVSSFMSISYSCFYLRISPFFRQAISIFVSAYTLVAISVDRYLAIIYPLRPRMTRLQAKVIIGAVWLLALLTTLPIAVFSRLHSLGEPRTCIQSCAKNMHMNTYT